ncbi:site-specific integrase [Longimycelium tulufanense]|uniref:Site-specific integrase n=1 Tax=Longimycelium tulufanense TaxID=907463 RepID=A0A8J3CEF1_9PSEU|nr:site-specific integrase [Longimycelium tulufanense]GGM82226.1 site-specific integrase [Longimycelium tulufanense]
MPRRKRPEGTRAPNGASSIYLGKDGYWHGRVTMGVGDDGKPDRRHVKRKDESEVIEAVRELERQRDTGKARKPGRAWTVEKWLRHWVENIVAPAVKYKTLEGYRLAVYKHLIPRIGAHRIDRLSAEHLESLYARMLAAGHAPGGVHQVHRTIKTALFEAMRRRHVTENVATIAKAPRLEDREVEPFTLEEAQRILKAASERRNGVRFVVALTLGLRKGEALGLKWPRVDLDKGLLRTPKQLQRRPWEHGCSDPHACGREHHKTEPCPQDCGRHTKCPPVCSPDCTEHAARCPHRKGGGLHEIDVKSRAGKRGVGIPAPLLRALREHKTTQAAEREHAGSLWQEGGWVFAQPNGRPIDPRADHREWKTLLEAAGVRDARLHDARHTAATMLLALGVPARAVMEIMGWSQLSMTQRYQHVTSDLVANIAEQVGDLFWGSNETQTETRQP